MGYEDMEWKQMGGQLITAQESRNGVPIGLLSGHFAAWSIDEPDFFGEQDRIAPTAFDASIAEHRARDNRQIRLRDNHHGVLIGGIPIETVRVDAVGLFGVAEVSLDVQRGQEIFSLAKQGVMRDFSVGIEVVDFRMEGNIRNIDKANIWEVSPVDEPRNRDAQVTDVKSVVPFQDLPLAPQDTPWDGSGTIGSLDSKAYVWRDQAGDDGSGAYPIRIAEMVDGQLKAVPRGIFAAADALKDAQSGVDIPQEDRAGVIRHLERYYAKMDLDSPFRDEDKHFFRATDVDAWGPLEMRKALKSTGSFSKGALTAMVDRLKRVDSEIKEGKPDIQALLNRIEETQAILS